MGKHLLTICYFGFKDTEILLFIAQSYLCQYTIRLIIIVFHLISVRVYISFIQTFFNSLGGVLVSAVPWG